MEFGSLLGGGNSNMLYFHPENWGRKSPILTSIFFKWVGEKPPTSLRFSLKQSEEFVEKGTISKGKVLSSNHPFFRSKLTITVNLTGFFSFRDGSWTGCFVKMLELETGRVADWNINDFDG